MLEDLLIRRQVEGNSLYLIVHREDKWHGKEKTEANVTSVKNTSCLKGRFHSKMKIYGNVELCLQIQPITLILLKNVSKSSRSSSGIYFDPSAVQ